ncbi:hypothetical protein D5S18_29280 [Nocardia panacis]|uniref:Uncharacterized protein n=1 Tax=Nocardia panacis TaxID=2340916 RepID=A0A3A4KL22_9NOCA|nr:hypothetical protein [Nocardia panacis]RJO69969.1 hypothetical protein D5S18_29280 [Nocardia panacis]
MRRLATLRRRPATAPARDSRTQPTESGGDPAIVAALIQPMLRLRASLGSGASAPDEGITRALSTASARAADAEAPHRAGLHALESTWESKAADAAVPALRTTQTQLGDISDRGPAYLSVLSDAQGTTSRAAQKVDQIIADFRRDAKQILGNASSSPETDAVIARATQALRDAVSTVQTARTEMDSHTQRLDAMGPLTVTQPAGVAGGYSTQYVPGATPGVATVPGVAGAAQVDPVQAAQLQVQQQLISAGVQVGTAAIDAGVNIGTHLIDKIVEIGTHAMDTVATSADKVMDKAIPELIHPGSTQQNGAGGQGSGNSAKLFDFGGGTGGGTSSPSANSPSGPPFTGARPESKPAAPEAPFQGAPPPPVIKPEPAPAPRSGGAETRAEPAPNNGMLVPPAASGGGDSEHKPRDGQLGVTTPAAHETVPVAVIGDFGDDAL